MGEEDTLSQIQQQIEPKKRMFRFCVCLSRVARGTCNGTEEKRKLSVNHQKLEGRIELSTHKHMSFATNIDRVGFLVEIELEGSLARSSKFVNDVLNAHIVFSNK
mmetsp:Transcript_25302/g.28950  ORF Transcript_25302/g.28950 Transcript_25302/m.28950 type:complete len:105 (-) Transcript_25302:981-1295(-)